MKTITLLTDFGLKDGYPGVMKGVILRIAPDAQIVDLSHSIPAQDVMSGAQVLGRSFSYFPEGTVHVGVVDPGVGTERRAIAARLGPYFFVLPDNGLITSAFIKAQKLGWQAEFYHLDNPHYWLPDVSNSFHGRDIFAPTGAHILAGVPVNELGTPIHDPKIVEFPSPERTPKGWLAEVIDVDTFGNLATNLSAEQIEGTVATVQIAGETIPFVKTFGEGQPGDLVALIDSDGRLSIAVVNGSASSQLHASIGQPLQVILELPAG